LRSSMLDKENTGRGVASTVISNTGASDVVCYNPREPRRLEYWFHETGGEALRG
jgi:hypothetical protein